MFYYYPSFTAPRCSCSCSCSCSCPCCAATVGWIHHLARHAVACFLTRGDLWQHWEEVHSLISHLSRGGGLELITTDIFAFCAQGVAVFDLWLLDDDYALNNANWQWLSCSNFFYQVISNWIVHNTSFPIICLHIFTSCFHAASFICCFVCSISDVIPR